MAEFELITIAGDAYPDEVGGALAATENALEFAKVLRAGGDVVGDTTHLTLGSKRDLEKLLDRWSKPDGPRSSIVYLVGHGTWHVHGQRHAFLVPEVEDKEYSEFDTENLAKYLLNEWLHRSKDKQSWALFILDCCQSSYGIGKINGSLESQQRDRPKRLGLWPVNVKGAANLGRFVTEFQTAVNHSFTENDQTIGLNEVFRRIRDQLGDVEERSNLPEHAKLTNPQRSATPLRVTMDSHDELRQLIADRPPEFRNHFLTKAQGAESGELAWYFVGRDEEIADIFGWLNADEPGMRVVTGDAGSGKSALLGHVAVLVDNELVAAYHEIAPHLADGPSSDGRCFDATVHLTGMTLHDLVVALSIELVLSTSFLKDLGISARSAGSQTNGLLEDITASLDPGILFGQFETIWGNRAPFTILIDALDESQEPEAIAEFLANLGGGDHNVRVLIGTRRSTKEGPDTAPDPSQRGLLDLLRVSNHDLIVLERDAKAAEEYAFRRLQKFGFGKADARTLAGRIGAENEHFLFARLATSELLAAHGTTRPTPDDLDRLLSGGHRGVFAAAINRLREDDPPVAVALKALSRARGRGLPRDRGVWQLVANVMGRANDIEVTVADIDRTLKKAAAYITLDAEAGMSTYRLAHQTFVEFFLYESGRRTGHGEIAAAIIARNSDDDGWAGANHYETRYVIEHATLAIEDGLGAPLDDLVLHPGWLDRASELIPIDSLISMLQIALDRGGEAATTSELPGLLVRILRNCRVTVAARPNLLGPMLAARGFPAGVAVAALAERPWLELTSEPIEVGAVWSTTYSTPGKVRALAFGTPNDEPMLAIGVDDRIEFWDPRTSGPDVGRTIHLDGRATALAFGSVDSAPALAVVRSYDQVLEIVDLAGAPVCEAVELRGDYVSAVALGEIGGVGAAALANQDLGEITVVRLEQDQGGPFASKFDGSNVVGVSTVDGALMASRIVTWEEPVDSAGGAVQTVRLEDGVVVAETPATETMLASLERTVAMDHGGVLIHATITGGQVRVWSPHERLLVESRELGDQRRTAVRTMAIVPLGDRLAIASAPDLDDTAMVHITDIAGSENRATLAEQPGVWVAGAETADNSGLELCIPEHESMPARTVASSITPDHLIDWPRSSYQEYQSSDRHLAVTGSFDSTAIVWDLTTEPATPVAGPFARRDSWNRYTPVPMKGGPAYTRDAALAAVDEHGLCIAIASDGGVRLERSDGGQIPIPLSDQFEDVSAIAMGVVANADVLAVGSQNGHLWVVGFGLGDNALLGEFSFNRPILRLHIAAGGRIEVQTSSRELHRFEVRFPPGTGPGAPDEDD